MYQPLRDYVLIKPIENSGPAMSKGGIIIPDTGKFIIQQGSVLAVGPDVSDISVGNVVIYEDNDSKGREEALDGQLKINRLEDNQLLIREENFIAVVTDD